MARLNAIYASALFDLAVESGADNEYVQQAILLRDALNNDECIRILKHPRIEAQEKFELFSKAFSGHINDNLMGFLHLVIVKNREAFLLPALAELIAMLEHFQGKATAKVLSATELRENQVAKLRGVLSQKLDKDVEVSLKVDPSIIGGQHIDVDGYYINWTVKNRLRDLTAHMKERCGT